MFDEVIALNAYSDTQNGVNSRAQVGGVESITPTTIHLLSSRKRASRTDLIQTTLVRENRDMSIVCCTHRHGQLLIMKSWELVPKGIKQTYRT